MSLSMGYRFLKREKQKERSLVNVFASAARQMSLRAERGKLRTPNMLEPPAYRRLLQSLDCFSRWIASIAKKLFRKDSSIAMTAPSQ